MKLHQRIVIMNCVNFSILHIILIWSQNLRGGGRIITPKLKNHCTTHMMCMHFIKAATYFQVFSLPYILPLFSEAFPLQIIFMERLTFQSLKINFFCLGILKCGFGHYFFQYFEEVTLSQK